MEINPICPKHPELPENALPERLARIDSDQSMMEVLMALSIFVRASSETEEDKTEAVSDTSLPSSDLVDLLLSEAKELLAPILSSKEGKHQGPGETCTPASPQDVCHSDLHFPTTFHPFPTPVKPPLQGP